MPLHNIRAAIAQKLEEEARTQKMPGPEASRAKLDFHGKTVTTPISSGSTVKIPPDISAPAVKIEDSKKKLRDLARLEPAINRTVRGAAKLADRITEDDRDAAHQAIRRALYAHSVIYDGKARQLVKTPDHKTQLTAATLLLAYDEGTPVKRIAAIVMDGKTAEERLNSMRASPEMLKVIQAVSGLGVGVEFEGEVIDIETTVVQKSGDED